MTIYDRSEMKNYNTILTEKLKKYQHYHLEKLLKRRSEKSDRTSFTNSPLIKALEKQTKTNEN